MTPQDLQAIVYGYSGLVADRTVLKLFANATEKERKFVASTAVELLRSAIDDMVAHVNWDANKPHVPRPKNMSTRRLAVLCTANFPEIKKFGFDGLANPDEAYVAMRDRRPDWLDNWLAFVCEAAPVTYWNIVRRLELECSVTCQRTMSYQLGMAMSGGADVGALLTSDPQLCSEELWDLLENEQSMRRLLEPRWTDLPRTSPGRDRLGRREELNRAQQDRCRTAAPNWKKALLLFGSEGKICPSRLLKIAFVSLAKISAEEAKPTSEWGLSETPISWWSTLIDGLPKESNDALLQQYLGLLSCKESNTLNWALNHIAGFPSNRIPLNDFCMNLGTVFSIKLKESAVKALKILQTLSREHVDQLELIGVTAAAAMEHSSVDVQKRAIELLEVSGAYKIETVAGEMRSRTTVLKGLLKQRVEDLLRAGGESDGAEGAGIQVAVDEEELRRRIESIEPKYVELARIDDALRALDSESGECPEGLNLNSIEIPRLDPDARISPVADLDELIFLAIHVLEGKANSIDAERLLDGVSRLCDLAPGDFADRVSALRKLVRKIEAADPWTVTDATMFFVALVKCWIERETQEASERTSRLERSFFQVRISQMLGRVAAAQPVPLLAMPSHAGGFIDPLLVRHRLAAYEAAGITPDIADVIQCLLRLAPENRDETLSMLPAGASEIVSAFRFACGGELEGPLIHAELWAAALRSRAPQEFNSELLEKFGSYGPDAFEVASFRANPENLQPGTYPQLQRSGRVLMTESCGSSGKDLTLFPLVLLHDHKWNGWWNSHSVELTWPLNQEPFLAMQVRWLANCVHTGSSKWVLPCELLFDPEIALNRNGTWLIAIGLGANNKVMSRFCLDALICGIEDGRIDGVSFGRVLSQICQSTCITLLRWFDAFREISRISPMHARFAQQALEQGLKGLPLPNQHRQPNTPWIELLQEICIITGEPVKEESTRTYLSSITSKGKGAKLAKFLLEMRPAAHAQSHYRAAALQLLEIRVARAEKWQTRARVSSMVVAGSN